MLSSRLLPAVSIVLTTLFPLRAKAISFVEGGWISPELYGVESVKIVDFNHDGRPDAVVVENQGTKVVWLENLGGGRFRQAGLWESTGYGMICHAVEDFDGDGNLDLLIPASEDGLNHYFLIYYGTGPGKFDSAGPTRVLAGDSGTYGIAKDINGDGRPDILSDHVWLNHGDGTFVAVSGSDAIASLPGRQASTGDAAAWGSDDAAPDLFVPGASGAVMRYPNLGDGRFGAGVTAIAGDPREGTTGLAVAVLPGISDQPCLVRTLQSGARQMIELYVRTGETFTLAAKLASGAYWQSGLQTLTDGDHSRILLTTGRTAAAISPTELLVTRKGAKISLKLAVLEKPSANRSAMALTDLNGDGTLDLVLANSGMGWHAGVPGATFSSVRHEVSAVDDGNTVCYAGDLDNDGAVDLITLASYNSFQPQRITLWKNSGHGESFQPTTLPVSADRVGLVAVGDWDHDGWPDLLVRTTKLGGKLNIHSTNRLLLISRFPNGRMAQKTLITNSGMAWTDASLQQGDADGVLDFVTNVYLPTDVYASHYQIFTGKTANSFATKPSGQGPVPLMKLFTDLDWNGTLDPTDRPDSYRYNPPWLSGGGSVIIDNLPPPTIPGSNGNLRLGDVWPTSLDFDHDGHPDFISKYNNYDVLMPARLTTGAAPQATYSQVAADYGNYAMIPNKVVCYARLHDSLDYDAVYQTEYDIRFRENLGGLNFAPEVILSEQFHAGDGGIMTADLDGDGVQDIIASSATDSSRLRWFKGVKN